MAEKQAGTFTSEDVMAMLGKLLEADKEKQMEMVERLAYKITHPDPTPEQVDKRKREMQERVEMAREKEALDRAKRENCPHRRIGSGWGSHAGGSVIAWHYTNLAQKDGAGRSIDGPQVAFGVCQWCGSEFKPGDADYAEKLMWGTNPIIGVFPMNKHFGTWQ